MVRRVDELGRVVIPKEIRRTLRIREGDPLEICTNSKDGTVTLKKYHPEKIFDFNDEELEEIIAALNSKIKMIDIALAFQDREDAPQLIEDKNLKYKESRYLCRTIINKIKFENKVYVGHDFYLPKEVITCDIDQGGCDKDFVLSVDKKVILKTFKIEGEE
ncbi:AbrB/MazE/SpoVT family DNA-binding domain-containing protein [Tissierella sp.]|uniref:AbrB/MazE/SpoVT family DNA-binding domain-containing protein n=1 Tax=Tissierella sp. TaxID=41274 RepID=UPI0037DC48A9